MEYGDVFENHLGTGCRDGKGREIGYIVGLRDNGTDFRAYVQNARCAKAHQWAEFGVQQRSKSFQSQAEATRWAYATAHARIANVRAQIGVSA